MRYLIPLMATLVLAPLAAAQEDGCLQANPCILDVEVDAMGIASLSVINVTTGDWFYVGVSNLDSRDHTITLAGHGVSVAVEGDFFADSQPFQFGAPGAYALRDSPTGDEATINVLAGDVVDAEAGITSSSGDGKGAPGPSVAVVALAVLACALFARGFR